MRKVVAVSNVTLDGVMQAPGRPDEDLRGGFQHGGWALPYNDSVKGRVMAEGMAQAGPLLFGRRTYQDFFNVWPKRKDNPFTQPSSRVTPWTPSRGSRRSRAWISSYSAAESWSGR